MKIEQKKKLIKVLKIVLNVFFYSVIAILVLFSIANMQLKNKDDIANIFGKGFLTVLTDSMTGDKEDSFTTNDVIFVELLTDKSREDLKVGDIITYFSMKIPNLNIQGFITHRIVEVFEIGDDKFIVTQGDKDGSYPDEPINIKEAVAVYQGKWEGIGNTLKRLQTPTGFATFVILPVALIFIIEAVILVRNIVIINNEKLREQMKTTPQENLSFDVEKEKERIRQQIIEEMKQQEDKNKNQ